MSEPRAHHYCPQFYLGYFTDEAPSTDGKLWVFDRKKKQKRPSKPINEAHQRDFYRVETVDASDPFVLEKWFSNLEGKARAAIDHLHQTLTLPDEESFVYLLNFCGLLAVRTPGFRQQISDFNEELIKKTLAISMADKARFEARKERLKKEGRDFSDLTFEEVQDFIQRDAYRVETHQNQHIEVMLKSASSIVDQLLRRNWIVVVAEEGQEFVCSDNPVGLVWTNPPAGARSPGFGLPGTEVTIPLSKKVGLIGIFEEPKTWVASFDRKMVATFNNGTLMRAERFVYSPSENFIWRSEDGSLKGPDEYFTVLGHTETPDGTTS